MRKQIKKILCFLLILGCLAPYDSTKDLLVPYISIVFSKNNSALLAFYKSFGVKDSIELFNKLINKVPETLPNLFELFRKINSTGDVGEGLDYIESSERLKKDYVLQDLRRIMIKTFSEIKAEEFFSMFVKFFINKFLDLASTANFLMECIVSMCLSWERLSQRLYSILLNLKIFSGLSQVHLLRWLSDFDGGLLGVMGNEVAALAAMSAHLGITREAAVSRSYPLTA